jgi:hypothetical protein
MTETTTNPDTEDRTRTLRDVSHTNPHTKRPFGDTQTFDRGKTVATDGGEPEAQPGRGRDSSDAPASDGGERDAGPAADADDPGSEEGTGEGTLGDVDHTPPGDTEGAHRSYERGHEGKTDVR